MLLGEIDLHLFGEGTHRRLWEMLGAVTRPDGRVRFAVWAPNARAVDVVGDWNGWAGEPLEPQGESGVWATLTDARPGQHYKFRITGADGDIRLKADPMARSAEIPPSDASVVTAPSEFAWTDQQWQQQRAGRADLGRPLRIYEAHLGSWRGGHESYATLGERLADHAATLGFTHVELLPLMEHPFGGSWGYQVTGYYAPTARHGTPDELRALVDACHRRGVGVILDWVPAHFPRDDWALARFDGTPLYEHGDPRRGAHPDWGTLVFDYGRREVRNFLLANALYWIDEFHVDGLRVDAVASMLYLDYSRRDGEWVPNVHGGREHLEAVEFLRDLNRVVGAEHPGTLVIAEESTSWPGVTRPVEQGGLGFTHKWNMGWMHDTLGYLHRDPVHRPWHHHDLTFGLLYAFGERYVLPLSHDEVVHGKGSLFAKMAGDDWQRFAALRALYGWMWALPGAPLLFMGAELAVRHEWRENEGLPWELLEHHHHRGVRDTVALLNATAEAWPALWERDHDPGGFRWLDADDATHSVYAFARFGRDGEAVACVANFTPVPRPGYRLGVPWAGDWQVLADTDAAELGGSGSRRGPDTIGAVDIPAQGQPASLQIDVGPLAVVLIGGRRS